MTYLAPEIMRHLGYRIVEEVFHSLMTEVCVLSHRPSCYKCFYLAINLRFVAEKLPFGAVIG